MVDFVPFPGLASTDNNTTYQANSVVTTANSGTVIAATSMVIYPQTGFIGIGTTIPAAQLDVYSGNVQFSRTGQSLRGDFSNAALASRTQIVTTTVNGNTTVPIVPNGTGIAGGLSLHNASDPGNSGFLNIFANTSASRIASSVQGTGTYVPMEFYTGGSLRMTITNQGNIFIPQSVGIGTSTSAGIFGTGTSNLYVYGNVFISNSGTTGSGVVFPDGTRQTSAAILPVSYGPVNTIQVAGSSNNFVGDGSLFVWDNTNKRLGIGTSTPAYLSSLYGTDYVLFNNRPGNAARQEIVVGNVVTYGAVLGYDPSIGQSIGYLRRGDSAATTPAISWSYVSSSYRVGVNGITQPQNTMDIAGAVAIGSGYSGANVMSNTNGLSVQGLVGIGTFTPFASLDVFANNSTAGATASHVMLRNGTGSQTVTGYQFAGTVLATNRVDSSGNWVVNSSANRFYFNNESIGSGTAGTANFWNNANFMNAVGTAVTFPGTTTVTGAANSTGVTLSNGNISVGSTAAAAVGSISLAYMQGIAFPGSSGNGFIYGMNTDGASNTLSNMQIRSWFGIGFGPSITGQTIPINENAIWMNVRTGDMAARGSLAVGTAATSTAGTILASGEITAYSSDGRLKENLAPIGDALGKLLRLKGVTFDWKDGVETLGFTPGRKHDVGVIAQEVQAVLPEAVRPAPFDTDSEGASRSGSGYLTVQYEKLTALLIEAVKEQQGHIADLEARVRSLEGGDAV